MFELTFEPFVAGHRLAVLAVASATVGNTELDRADAVLDAVDGEHDVGAILVCAGETGFVSGLDLDALAAMTDRRDIGAFVLRLHGVLRRLAGHKRPVVAAVDGPCLDAGFELVLGCHGVVATDRSRTMFGLPQIELGLLPGGGALSVLPKRIGLEPALDLILGGRRLRADVARRLGLVDEVVRPEALVHSAIAVARQLHADGGRRRQPGRTWSARIAARNPVRRTRLVARIRGEVLEQGFGLDPAPLSALDLVSRGERSADADAAAFAELAVGEVARARVAVERRARALRALNIEEAQPRPLQRLGILGAGVMGADLSVAAALASMAVRIREKEPAALARALRRVEDGFDRGGPSRRSAAGFRARARVSGGLDLRGFETMDMVLEAVPEDLALKQRVLAELEARIPADTVIATHPRALRVREIGAELRERERLVGLRFFPPVARMPLCEVVRTPETSPRTMATALAFVRAVGKTPVVVRDGPGFFATRVLAFYLLSAIELVAAGHRIEDVDLGARRAGWPVGPLRLLDEVGLDAAVSVGLLLREAFGARLRVPPGLEAMAESGRTGVASGRGFYLHPKNAPRKPDPDVYATLGAVRTASADPEELGDRLTLVAALEAVRCLQDEVILDPRDGDVAGVLGIGYPAQRGGPFRHLAARGLAATRSRLAALEDRFGSSFAAPPLLVELARMGGDFSVMEGRRR